MGERRMRGHILHAFALVPYLMRMLLESLQNLCASSCRHGIPPWGARCGVGQVTDVGRTGAGNLSLPQRLFVRQTWIEDIAQAVAKQIEGQHRIGDGQPRKDRDERA